MQIPTLAEEDVDLPKTPTLDDGDVDLSAEQKTAAPHTPMPNAVTPRPLAPAGAAGPLPPIPQPQVNMEVPSLGATVTGNPDVKGKAPRQQDVGSPLGEDAGQIVSGAKRAFPAAMEEYGKQQLDPKTLEGLQQLGGAWADKGDFNSKEAKQGLTKFVTGIEAAMGDSIMGGSGKGLMDLPGLTGVIGRAGPQAARALAFAVAGGYLGDRVSRPITKALGFDPDSQDLAASLVSFGAAAGGAHLSGHLGGIFNREAPHTVPPEGLHPDYHALPELEAGDVEEPEEEEEKPKPKTPKEPEEVTHPSGEVTAIDEKSGLPIVNTDKPSAEEESEASDKKPAGNGPKKAESTSTAKPAAAAATEDKAPKKEPAKPAAATATEDKAPEKRKDPGERYREALKRAKRYQTFEVGLSTQELAALDHEQAIEEYDEQLKAGTVAGSWSVDTLYPKRGVDGEAISRPYVKATSRAEAAKKLAALYPNHEVLEHQVGRKMVFGADSPQLSDVFGEDDPDAGKGLSERVAEQHLAALEDAVGQKEPESGRVITQPTDKLAEAQKLATAAAPELKDKLAAITKGIDGASVDGVREAKDRDRALEKSKQQDQPVETISDLLAGRIAVDSPEAHAEVAAALKAQFPVIKDQNQFEKGDRDYGFRNHTLQLGMGNGSTAEVQIVPREIAEAEKETHANYEQGRAAELSGRTEDAGKAKAANREIHAAAMEKFNARNAETAPKKGELAPTTAAPAKASEEKSDETVGAATGQGWHAGQAEDGSWHVVDAKGKFINRADSKADAEQRAEGMRRLAAFNQHSRQFQERAEAENKRQQAVLAAAKAAAGPAPPKLAKGTQVVTAEGKLAKVDFHDHGRTGNARLTLADGTKGGSVPGKSLAPIQPLKVKLHDTGSALEKTLEKRVEGNAPQMIADMLRKNTGADGVPTVSVDLAKLEFPEYRADPVGREEEARGSAVALSEAAWNTALARPVDPARPYVLLQTGSPASGKSTGLESLQSKVALKREMLMRSLEDTRHEIQQVLDSGRQPVILVTFLDDPAEQVTRMIQRALGDDHTKGIGRIVPLPLMADTLVSIPKTVATLEKEFGDRLTVHSIDNSGKPGEAKSYDGLSRAAENAAKWTRESALEVMRARLEELRTTRDIPEKSYQRALGTAESGQPDRQGNSGRDEQALAPQASKGLATAERPPPQEISVAPDLFKQITEAYSADKIGQQKSTIRPPFTYEDEKWTTVMVQGRGLPGGHLAEAYRVVPLEANEGGLLYHASNSEARRNRPEGAYHGIEVSLRGKRFMMKGPPVTFVPGEAKPQTAAAEKGKARAAFTRAMTKRAKAADAAAPATVEPSTPEQRNYSAEVRRMAGDADFQKVSIRAENRRQAEQLLAEQYPGKHISEVDRLATKWPVAATPKAEDNKPHTHAQLAADQPAGTPGNAEDAPSVPGPAGEGGESPRAVQPEGAREDEGSGDAALDAGRADAVGVEHDGGLEEGGSSPERSGGAGEPDLVPARGEGPGEPRVAVAQKALVRNANNFHITDEHAARIGTGGEISKIKGNLDALATLKKIQAEGRETATPEEQQSLAQYVDFGGLVGMLQNPYSPQYRAHYARFTGMLSSDEIQEIRETLPNTHYTSLEMVDWMWRAMARMGLQGGRILEPGMGIGNFLGRMPGEISKRAEIFGVERNPLTGAMAQMLYPDAKISVKPFQKFLVPDNSLNAAIGNVPFQDTAVTGDPAYAKLKLNLHNYFIIKTLDKLKPGGVAALITSRYTMDGASGPAIRAREEMARRADLLMAIRLPDKAFKGNAGTEVVADLLIFRKRAAGDVPETSPNWLSVGPTTAAAEKDSPAKEFLVNRYFLDHPEHVLGTHSQMGKMYGPGQYTVKAGEDFPAALEALAEQVPLRAIGKFNSHVPNVAPATLDPGEMQLAPEDVKPGAFFRNDKGVIQVKQSGVGSPLPAELSTPAMKKHIGDAIDLRDQLNRTIKAQLASSDDTEMKAEQKKLEGLYDRYVKQHGPLADKSLRKAFSSDPEYSKLLALEKVDPESKSVTKADIFTKRVLSPFEPLRDLPDDPNQAMLKVIAEKGTLDTRLMAELLKKPEEEVVGSLEKAGLIYRDPKSGEHVTADEYLSGNVRDKLGLAKQAAESDPAFKRNVAELEKVQPKPLDIHAIQPNLGVTWIPRRVYKQFIQHLGGSRTRSDSIEISRDLGGKWLVQVKSAPFELTGKWGGGGIPGHKLVQYAMNQQMPTVYHQVPNASGEGTHAAVAPEATAAARAKLQAIKEEFRTVLRRAPDEIVANLEKIYNDTFGGYRRREFSGEHLSFPGMSEEWQQKIRGYQKASVWQIVQEGRAGIFHAPGLGKTLTMATAGMELRRLGLSRKNMYAVPNHMIPQWRDDFKRFYPNSNVLAALDDDFTAENRNKLMSRIATGDWDAVIVPHSQFDRLPISPQWEAKTINKRLADYRAILEELDEDGDKRRIKEIEKLVDKLEARLNTLNSKVKDNTIHFDEMGIDQLFVDEAHLYKSMAVPSKMTGIAGVASTASQRAFALEMKADYLRDTHNGRGLVFGTGTPMTNTMGEVYVMTKYLAPDLLEQAGIKNFDDWAAQFATAVTTYEYGADGVTFKPKTALSEFVNVPELSTMFRRFADYLSKEAARKLSNLKEPEANRTDHLVKITPTQEPLLEMVARRGQQLTDHPPRTKEEKKADNWLKLSSDARKISLDPRLYDPSLPDDPGSKANLAVAVIKKTLDATTKEKGTVAVFSEFFAHRTPDGKADFNIFDDMRTKLVKAGVPRDQIAIVQETANKEEKELVFSKVRSGRIRVVFGSTEKMGMGTNMQDRLKAILHIDQPWRPDQIEQREGRGIRSGNMWESIDIHRFIAEPREGKVKVWDKKEGKEVEKDRPRAYDLQMYQQLARKSGAQEQFLSGNYQGRSMEDVGGDVKLNAQMFAVGKALATGNPDAMRKLKLENELTTYQMLQRGFQTERSRNARELLNSQANAAHYAKVASVLDKALAILQKNVVEGEDGKEAYPVVVGDKTFSTVEERAAFVKSNPPLGEIMRDGLKVAGLDVPLEAGVQGYSYGFLGETNAVPNNSKNEQTLQSLLSGFMQKVRAVGARARSAELQAQSFTDRAEAITKQLAEKDPYSSKVDGMEKELKEIDARLGIKGPAQEDEIAIDEGSGDEEEPKTPGAGTTLRSGFLDPELFKQTFGDAGERLRSWLDEDITKGDKQAEMMRDTRGQRDRRVAMVAEKLKTARNGWMLRSRADSMTFWNAIENDDISALSPKDQHLAQFMLSGYRPLIADIQALRPEALQHLIQNYFPHIWKNPSGAHQVIMAVLNGKRPFAGRASFLKQRSIPTMQDGIDMGLVPASWNPVDQFLTKYAEMAQFLMGYQTLDMMKKAGTAKFVRLGQKAPDGWTRLDDKIGTVYRRATLVNEDQVDDATHMHTYPGGKRKIPGIAIEDLEDAEYTGTVLTGNYFAPADAARVFNNFVSRGMAGQSRIYDALNWVNNNMNALQLGISAFHATTTSVNAATSEIAIGIKQLSEGKPLQAAGHAVSGVLTVPSLIRTAVNGHRLMREYLHPGSYSALAREAAAIAQAGGRIRQNTLELKPFSKMVNAFRNGAIGEGLSAIPGTILQASVAPVMDFWVPRMKLGAFYDMAHDVFDQAARKGWGHEEVRRRLQKAWDQVDDRFGQIVYDNLFWHKGLRDALQLGTRSVGWNYGTGRTLVGASTDTIREANKALHGEAPEVTDRMAFAFALPIYSALIGAVLTYLWNKHGPQTWKDYYYPMHDGRRMSIPGYMKDYVGLAVNPVGTVINKMGPLMEAMGEMLENRDFYGVEIRHKDDNPVKQFAEVASWAASTLTPFAAEGTKKMLEAKGEDASVDWRHPIDSARRIGGAIARHPGDLIAGNMGAQPAPAYIQNSPALNMARDYERANSPPGTKTQAQADRTRHLREIEDMYRTKNVKPGAIKEYVTSGKLSEQDVFKAQMKAGQNPLVAAVRGLSIEQALNVYEAADPQERKLIGVQVERKAAGIETDTRLSEEKRDELQESYRRLFGFGTPSTKSASIKGAGST